MIRPAQIRAARTLLQWTIEEFAEAVKISPGKLHMAETCLARPEDAGVNQRIRKTLEAAGIDFTYEDERGVRLREKNGSDAPIVEKS